MTSDYSLKPFTLSDFVTESNRIEGLGPAQAHELLAHELLLRSSVLTVSALAQFVRTIADAPLRARVGMDVRIGNHVPPPGGPAIVDQLNGLLDRIYHDPLCTPYTAHHVYETLHPFIDGNGRSGRALWLWQMGGIARAPLGFLHHFYYQTLDAGRPAP